MFCPFKLSPLKFLDLTVLYGRQRKVLDYAKSNVRGIDANIDLSKIAKDNPKTKVTTGFSVISRYQQYTGPDPNFPSTVNAVSSRMNISGGATSLSLEYVNKGKDPHEANGYDQTSGEAFLSHFTYTKNNFGGTLSLRALENMDYRSEREDIQSTGLMNYLPALTRQHDHLTTNIYVYNAQAMGEFGGQIDLFYNAPKGSSIGGKYGSQFSLNYSHFGGHEDADKLFSVGDTKYFHDLNIEWKRKWSEKWTTILLYQNLFYNKLVIEGEPLPNVKTNTVVLNTIFKYANKRALRFELQHLATKEDKGNWAAALTEFTFAPKWSFYVSDLYNYGKTDTHYYNFGGNYTQDGTRFGLSYGRQRAGLFCVGGVCRYVPAATGFTATLATTFNN